MHTYIETYRDTVIGREEKRILRNQSAIKIYSQSKHMHNCAFERFMLFRSFYLYILMLTSIFVIIFYKFTCFAVDSIKI